MDDVDPLVRAVCAAQPRGHYFSTEFGKFKSIDNNENTRWNYCIRCNVVFHELGLGESFECANGYCGGLGVEHPFIYLTPPPNETIVSTLGSEEKG